MSATRARLRRLAFGLRTLLGLGRRGYFIPYRYAETVPQSGDLPTYGALEKLFDQARPEMLDVLARIAARLPALQAIDVDALPPQPRWNQSWYPGLDAAAAYTLVCETKPARILEVGSGHSTRFLARAVADSGLDCQVTAIDPAPRADLGNLPVELLRMTLQEAGTAPFAALRGGDIMLIDSSHILMPGSDVDFLLGRVLPDLPIGTRVAFHDIFLPDDYPASWSWRGYNEQQGLMGLLQGGGWRILFSSHFARTRLADKVSKSAVDSLMCPGEAHETVLWIQRVSREYDVG
ncbi:class I SAM-dependent methyltransferase [Limibacillus halophilus]|uniref:Methyltransferase domain-containing protein n=1 Tax=Limibacillus halophilus TaxID=1579333 RepID=A0A839SPQ3_9PROT|nr:class I SAM-dependent methyltransferase [Limibacillus halophilus]MBB3063909.1 hypothetical protein [Limibacillus halophilus]